MNGFAKLSVATLAALSIAMSSTAIAQAKTLVPGQERSPVATMVEGVAHLCAQRSCSSDKCEPHFSITKWLITFGRGC